MKGALCILILLLSGCYIEKNQALKLGTSMAEVSEESKACLSCHSRQMEGMTAQWEESRHAQKGIGCYECHSAKLDDNDSFEHHGFVIAIIVSPKDCSQCHYAQASEFKDTVHSHAGQVIGSGDNFLGEVVEGYASSLNGCQSCHGSVVKADEGGQLSADTWPNFGIGRINPDGSEGSCAACHSRHSFTKAQVRDPETCGKCHLGPDHPQIEVYKSSKHGMAFNVNKDKMNMASDEWIVGKDYDSAPTCATCHLTATENQKATHDISTRLSWNIRAPISFKTEDYDTKRKKMKDVCYSCHGIDYIENYYTQLDAGIENYNNKFAIPATEIMNQLKEEKLVDPIPFNEEVEWHYWHLWHHEGRRARNGFAMLSPDYVQWHGMYEVAENFYFKFKPEAEHLKPGIMDEIMNRPENRWMHTPLSTTEWEELREKELSSYK